MEKARLAYYNNQTNNDVDAIINLIDILKGENGCPWDKKQTPKSMVVYLLEEAYELVEAITANDDSNICEEIGDVLFQLLFILTFFKDKQVFDFKDVVKLNIEKMVRRHPHVFGKKKLSSSDEVITQWNEIKKQEKQERQGMAILDSIPKSMPALLRSFRVSEKAARAGFDWNDIKGVMNKVEEEWAELKVEIMKSSKIDDNIDNISMEFGDLLFTLTNVARFAKIHPETALTDATNKFEKRFKYMENMIKETGRKIESVSYDELDVFWQKSKEIFN